MRPNLACFLLGATALSTSLLVNAADAAAEDQADGIQESLPLSASVIHIGQVVVIDEEVISIAAGIAAEKAAKEDNAQVQEGEAGEQKEVEDVVVDAEENKNQAAPAAEAEEVKETDDQKEEAPSEKDDKQQARAVAEGETQQAYNVPEEAETDDTPQVEDAVEEPEDAQTRPVAEEQEDQVAVEEEGVADEVILAEQKINALDQSAQLEESKQRLTSTLGSSSDAATTIDTVFTFSPITLAPESSRPARKTTTSSTITAAPSQKASAAPQIVKKVKSSASTSASSSMYLTAAGSLMLSICLFSQYF